MAEPLPFAVIKVYVHEKLQQRTFVVPTVAEIMADMQVTPRVVVEEPMAHYPYITHVDDNLKLVADPARIAGVALVVRYERHSGTLWARVVTTCGHAFIVKLGPQWNCKLKKDAEEGQDNFVKKVNEYYDKFVAHFGPNVIVDKRAIDALE